MTDVQNLPNTVPAEGERTGEEPTPIVPDGLIPLVALAGSAGSVAALQEFFRSMPADSDMAFVVIAHLSPEYEGTLVELLQRFTDMPVVTALNGSKIEANGVYVTPPGKLLTSANGSLHLSPAEDHPGKRVAGDIFFCTLAGTHGPRSIAVVLSGADGDGALGLKRIKEDGGLTIAQDPEEAENSEMPSSAIATGLVDWVLPVREMPFLLLEYVKSRKEMRLTAKKVPPLSAEVVTKELNAKIEELQATNEELIAINDELKNKLDLLEFSNCDLQNLMSASDIATVFVDRDLRVVRFTPLAAPLFDLVPGDIGRPLSDLSSPLDYPEIVTDAKRALDEFQPAHREVRAGDRYLLARARAYCAADARIAGVVFTFLDITERKKAEEALRASEKQLRSVYDGTHEYVALLAADGILLEANRAALGFAGSKPEEVVGQPFWESIWFRFTPGVPAIIQRAVERAAKGELVRFDTEIKAPGGELRTFDISLDPLSLLPSQ